ncbi:MFS transporter [Natronococcus wangiae]|uniref:MFS transporter n=1 Tax=Natronococcus wangiae TaxID=3068275 RepID=UPI00273D5A9F|nr:MFS transporter [Natronococcus sp. AD5]
MVDEPDPVAVADAATTFREKYESGEEALETLLEVDAEHETWSFDDIPLDSGTFGEIVSRGIVTKVDGEYRVSSREGVRAGLDGRPVSLEDDRETGFGLSIPITFDRRAAGALVVALGVLFATRSLIYRSVMRGEYVVPPSNDPYHYRYWLEVLLAEGDGSVITNLPEGAAETRPLTHAANWFFAVLLGGDRWAADMVTAWFPVVATVALGIVVYWLAVVVTDDVRVGVVSVFLLAITPLHTVYTSIGYLEHRSHQYFWLGVTMLTLAWLAVDLERRRDGASTAREAIREHLRQSWTWVAAVALGIAVGFSVHAWGGGILLLIPVAVYVGLKVAVDVRVGLPPALANLPILVGLGLGAALAAFLHFSWGWHEVFAAAISMLVVGGAVAVVGLGELWRRLEWPTRGLVGLEGGLAGIGLVAFRYLRPEDWARLSERALELFFRGEAVETATLFSMEQSIVLGPLPQFGVWFYIAILFLGWACWTSVRRYAPGWTLLSVYGVFWLVLAAIQARFAGQLTIPLSVLGGLGFVHLLAWANLARVPAPFRETDGNERDGTRARTAAADGGDATAGDGKREPSIIFPRDPRTLVALVWIGFLIFGMSLFFVPTIAGQITHSDAEFEAAMAIDDHATDVDREYPDNFVLSNWGDNRMYNYFVNGEADRYAYAYDNFDEFQTDDDPDGWYEEFERSQVGYVVLTDEEGGYPEDITQAKLHDELGAGGDDGEPLEHYQAIYIDDEVTAFAVVPGATITATGEPGETVVVETEVTVSGETITYERNATVREDGSLEVTVPYPGEYTVDDREVDVSTEAVENGSTVQID